MNNIRLIQHGSNSASSSHNLLANTTGNQQTSQQHPSQSLLTHNLQLTSSSLQPHNVALPPFAGPSAYAAFAYNPESYLHNPQATCYTMCRAGVVEPSHLQPEYAHELYSQEMLTNQSHGSAFLQLGNSQPIQTHSFHGFQLKQESEPEPSSDESSFGEHGGVIKKVQRIKNPKDFSNDKLTVISPDLSNIVQQQNCSSQSNHFCFVPGRLSLLSSSAKYEVTVDEIGRRINPPESLNASVLGSILRRAKAKDGGKSLRDKLKTHGLVLPAGRRKASNVNSLTALVEHEASQLAGDFERLCENDFPARSMAEYLTRHSDSMALEQRKQLIHLTKQLIGEFCEILSKDGSPLCSNNLPSHTLEPSIQKPLTHFSLVTHGFGSRAVNAGLNAFTNYLDETLKLLDTK